MTAEQEIQKTQEYRDRIDAGLRRGTESDYQELCTLCDEERFCYLAERDRELAMFRRVMQIWNLEKGRSETETIIGRTAAFWEEPRTAVTCGQLIDVYTILKFMIFRLESDLPEEAQVEGVSRVLTMGLTPDAIVFAAACETKDRERTLLRFTEVLKTMGGE